MYVQAKLNMRALLDQVFPAYEKVFRDMYSVTALRVLAQCLEGQTEDLSEIIQRSVGRSHSRKWVGAKV